MTEMLLKNRTKIALLYVDMQNDFLHPEGAYARAGQESKQISQLPARLRLLGDAVRSAGGWIVSTQFTLVPSRNNEPIISPHLKRLRPFLKKGDFCPGEFGHQLIDDLAPADLTVEKIAYSAFYMTRMEWVLRKTGIEQLIVGGIVTNGGVASTVRDCHVRDFSTILLQDGTGAFSDELHNNAIQSLSAISPIASCSQVITELQS